MNLGKYTNMLQQISKKLNIVNRTQWPTRSLRTVMLKVLNANIKLEGPLRHPLRVTIVHSKKRWHGRGGYTGYAYLHSGTMKLRVPKPDDACQYCTDGKTWGSIIDGKLADPSPCSQCKGTGKSVEPLFDVFEFAHLFEHELMHCRGYKHETMGWLNRWSPEKKSHYPYLDGATVSPKLAQTAAPVDRVAIRAQRVAARIVAWERKKRRADSALKKLYRQQKYYQTT